MAMMINLSKFLDKLYLMAEGGSRYCSKKSDDICGDVCDEGFDSGDGAVMAHKLWRRRSLYPKSASSHPLDLQSIDISQLGIAPNIVETKP
ncbi:hypothetical protein L6452_36992 [Arctium lappa]|uniref:Uncharacterized protein n=1 Tax=Arctium lappa TaxID=4217 RepID=A0ACB8Y163_ARCLA|nr:hypothetical protein L6452_36992 [Arctium lappa]